MKKTHLETPRRRDAETITFHPCGGCRGDGTEEKALLEFKNQEAVGQEVDLELVAVGLVVGTADHLDVQERTAFKADFKGAGDWLVRGVDDDKDA